MSYSTGLTRTSYMVSDGKGARADYETLDEAQAAMRPGHMLFSRTDKQFNSVNGDTFWLPLAETIRAIKRGEQ